MIENANGNLGSLFKVVDKMKCVIPANTAQLPKHLVVMTMIRLTQVIWLVLCTHSKLYGVLYTWTSLLRLAWLWSSRIFTTLAALLLPDLLGREGMKALHHSFEAAQKSFKMSI